MKKQSNCQSRIALNALGMCRKQKSCCLAETVSTTGNRWK